MRVTSEGIVNGVIQDRYGKYGQQHNRSGVPTCSLPLEIHDAPQGTRSFALFLEDKDACPVSGGFSWVHWVAANITDTRVEENASQNHPGFVQGLNSWVSLLGGRQDPALCACYGGMAPPNEPHVYELHVYALDTLLDLEDGFWFNQMFRQMEGHVLDQYTLKGTYRN